MRSVFYCNCRAVQMAELGKVLTEYDLAPVYELLKTATDCYNCSKTFGMLDTKVNCPNW